MLLRRPKKSQVEGILQCFQISRDIFCWKKDTFIFEPLALVTLGVFFVFLSAVYYYISCHNIVLIKEVHFLGFMFINSFVQGYTVFSLRKIMLATSHNRVSSAAAAPNFSFETVPTTDTILIAQQQAT